MDYALIRNRIEKLTARINEIGGEVQEVIIGEPVSLEQVVQMEKKLGVKLPGSFRTILLEFSGNFSVRWFLPDELEPPEEFRDIYCGTLHWSLDIISQCEEERLEWIETVFPDSADNYDVVWHDKLAFSDVGNGDYLAFDMTKGIDDAAVVYLSHDDGDGHGYKLANNYDEFIENWSRVAFAGSEDWQWLPFTTSPESGIIGDGEAAKRFRAWLGLDS